MTSQEAGRKSVGSPVSVRPLRETDLDRADEILRVAFGTFLGVPDPFGTADYVRTRFAADPHAAFAATVDGELAGSNSAANWGHSDFTRAHRHHALARPREAAARTDRTSARRLCRIGWHPVTCPLFPQVKDAGCG